MDLPRGALVGHVVAEDSGEDMEKAHREAVMMGDMGVVVAMEVVIMEMVVALVMIGKLYKIHFMKDKCKIMSILSVVEQNNQYSFFYSCFKLYEIFKVHYIHT